MRWNGYWSRVGQSRRARWILGLGAVAAMGLVAPWRVAVVHGTSMEPTLVSGAVVLFDREYYQRHSISPGDVVLLRVGGETWIKRVYAVGGERFWVWSERDDNQVRWEPIRAASRADFVRAAEYFRRKHSRDTRVTHVNLPPDKLFVMGDGASSFDSRDFGPVETDAVLGRVVSLPGQRLQALPATLELIWRHKRPAPADHVHARSGGGIPKHG